MGISIINGDRVRSLFGYWPQFCDARIIALSVVWDARNSLSLTTSLSYIDSEKNVAADVEIFFLKISALNLTDLLDDNVLDELVIAESSMDGILDVEIMACYGLAGSFKCEEVNVTNLHVLTL